MEAPHEIIRKPGKAGDTRTWTKCDVPKNGKGRGMTEPPRTIPGDAMPASLASCLFSGNAQTLPYFLQDHLLRF